MEGLTNIISKINSDAQIESGLIISSANEKAKEILAKADADAEKEKEKLLMQAKNKAELIKSKAVSGSELEYKRILLAEKCRILDEVLKESVDYICNLDEAEYFDLVRKLILSNALAGNGLIFFNQKDINRLPSDYIDNVNASLEKNRSVKLSCDAIDCTAGFVIEYDNMRVDCTIESLICDKTDEIKDELSKILF